MGGYTGKHHHRRAVTFAKPVEKPGEFEKVKQAIASERLVKLNVQTARQTNTPSLISSIRDFYAQKTSSMSGFASICISILYRRRVTAVWPAGQSNEPLSGYVWSYIWQNIGP